MNPIKRSIQVAIDCLEDANASIDHSDECVKLNTKDGVVLEAFTDAWDVQLDVCITCSLQLALFNAEEALEKLGGAEQDDGTCDDCGEPLDEHEEIEEDGSKPPPKKEWVH